jgi:hypothetical protein
MGTICKDHQLRLYEVMKEENAHRSNVFFVELRPDDCSFDKVANICHVRESTQRRRKRLFDMSIGVAGHLDPQASEIEICEHAIMGTASIVEGKLDGH